MSYPPYPAYKESGVPWFDVVPEHWDVRRLKDVSRLKGGAGFPLDEQGVQGEELYFYKVGDLSLSRDGVHLDASPHTICRTTAAKLLAAIIPKDSICYAKIGAALLLNRRRITTADCCIDNNMTALMPRTSQLDYKYAFHWMSTVDFGVHTNPGAVPSLSEGYQSVLPIALPPLEEQTGIARFLDEKTAEIDGLIAKKEEILRLLAEQRTALITHAVTKGLNPNAPMKRSGIDWLGDVPEGWEVKPFKREVWYQEGPGIMAVDFRDAGIPLLRIRNLKPGKVELEGCNFLDQDMANGKWAHFKVEEGDRLISTSASTGLVSVVDADAVGAIPYTGIIRIRPRSDNLLPEFLEYFVSSELFFDQIELLATGTTIQHFGPYHLNQMIMAVPPVQEQGRLIEKLASDLSKISETKGMVEIALDRLKEYRTALVTNAVTGKIKVA